jgi:hypothetical protein
VTDRGLLPGARDRDSAFRKDRRQFQPAAQRFDETAQSGQVQIVAPLDQELARELG